MLVQLGRGISWRADAPLVDEDLHEVAARAPDATLCLLTALARHGLTDRIPASLDMALPRHRRQSKVRAVVSWHRLDAATYNVGRGVLDLGDGHAIRAVRRRTLRRVDAFRLRHLVGEDVAIEALRRLLRAKKLTPTKPASSRSWPGGASR